jgi:putative ABC transport system ATP-binding protein
MVYKEVCKENEVLIRMVKIRKVHNTGGIICPVLNEVDLTVCKGEFLMIMGSSGSGKTTLLNLIGCLDRSGASGTYYFQNRNVENLSDKQLSYLRNREFGFIFQSFNLLPRLSAHRNVELPLIYQEIRTSRRREIAEKMLERVGLAGKGNRRPVELSGGEQQRVAIARALATHPSLLLADEPTGNLDSRTGLEIMKIIKELHESGMTIIMVTHDQELAAYADHTIHIKDGRIVKDS